MVSIIQQLVQKHQLSTLQMKNLLYLQDSNIRDILPNYIFFAGIINTDHN